MAKDEESNGNAPESAGNAREKGKKAKRKRSYPSGKGSETKGKRGRPRGGAIDMAKKQEILELRAKGLAYREVAKLAEVSEITASKVCKQFESWFRGLDLDAFERNREKFFDASTLKALKYALSDNLLSDSNLSQLTSFIKAMHTQQRLESGKSTSNQSTSISKFIQVSPASESGNESDDDD